MSNNWNSMRAMSRTGIVLHFGLIGAVAGVVAWVLVFALHVLFEVARPSVMALLLAIPRGAVVGMIMAVILHAYWKRQSSKN